MKIPKLILVLTLAVLTGLSAFSQEINCNVSINTSQINATDKKIYDNMKQAITDFMRTTKWSDEEYQSMEKIECNIVIILSARNSVEQFTGSIQIQSVRPVFGTNYNSPVFNFIDKDFTFEYIDQQPIQWASGVFTSNLSSILAFYAYTIIGLDNETFEKKGGTKYLGKAMDVVTQAQGKNYNGWDAFADKQNNRYYIINQYTSVQFAAMREAMYNYHRLGLDNMLKDKDNARKTIYESLKSLEDIEKETPNTLWMQIFFNAKRDEIIKIFSDATPAEIADLKDVIHIVDDANYTKYTDKLK